LSSAAQQTNLGSPVNPKSQIRNPSGLADFIRTAVLNHALFSRQQLRCNAVCVATI
jgi:hypothetical protein